ncbi:MAG: ABC transporter ATP-binding protein [Deltaproteobacteria bacterium]|nr:ABC transporter ATP-binding protein [Deltaproteobacteria bacterium]
MGDIAIKVEGLGKQYRLGVTPEKYYNLRDAIVNTVKAPFKKFARLSGKTGPEKEMFWALKDVSFEVKDGEVLGIIGRNGAGKSTLLKILSRITEPTEGCVKLYGRVGSLLEVGTGFHPELTGRENIYLSGAILGMRKLEINRKFDEIVDFAGIEKFLDTPVKRYSSGMYVRLAFAVAAHLDPEILLIDEVLAVGDAEFQQKCLTKMGEVSKKGRTVIFVSHSMQSVMSLTKLTLCLDSGKLHALGPSKLIVQEYLACFVQAVGSITKKDGVTSQIWETRESNLNAIQIVRVELCYDGDLIDVRAGFSIRLRYTIREPVSGSVLSAIVHDLNGNSILSTEDVDLNPELLDRRPAGYFETNVKIPGDLLSPGKYCLRVHSGIVKVAIFDNLEVFGFEIIETGDVRIRGHKQAYVLPYLTWKTHPIDNYV